MYVTLQLRRLDAIVHICYEVAGTIAAFTSWTLIQRAGTDYSFFLSSVSIFYHLLYTETLFHTI
jgi:hypothetical protein